MRWQTHAMHTPNNTKADSRHWHPNKAQPQAKCTYECAAAPSVTYGLEITHWAHIGDAVAWGQRRLAAAAVQQAMQLCMHIEPRASNSSRGMLMHVHSLVTRQKESGQLWRSSSSPRIGRLLTVKVKEKVHGYNMFAESTCQPTTLPLLSPPELCINHDGPGRPKTADTVHNGNRTGVREAVHSQEWSHALPVLQSTVPTLLRQAVELLHTQQQ